MKTAFSSFLIIAFTIQLLAQEPTIIWQNNYGGSNDDSGRSICKTTDDGFIVAGQTDSNDGNVTGNHGGSDCWIIKFDMNYSIEWQKCYGGSEDESAISIIQTSDNGFAFTGVSNSNDGDLTQNNGGADIWVVKLNPIGDIDWQKSIGGPLTDIGWHIIETTEGDFIVAGKLENPINFYDDEAMLIKISSAGDVIWEKYYGGSLWENAKHITQTDDGGYVFVGEAYSSDGDLTGNYGHSDCWIVKLNPEGIIEWQKNLGGSSYDYASCIIQNEDGTFILSGSTQSNDFNVSGNHGELDAWIVLLSSSGDIIWQNCYGGSEYDGSGSIIKKMNTGYLFLGSTNSEDGNVSGLIGLRDIWLVEIDNLGELLWQQCYGGSLSDHSSQIQNTTQNEFLIVGNSESEDYNLTGNYGMRDYWVYKIDTEVGINKSLITDQFILYPNPTQGLITYQSNLTSIIEIRNTLGEIILYEESYGTRTLDISNHPNGVYIVNLRDQYNKTIEIKKIIKY